MRILIVEDEPVLSDQLAQAVAAAGYAVDTALDGDRADFYVRTETYDAVVLDLGLPRVDGLTLLRGWRESSLTVPVLALTARSSWHETVEGSIRALTTTSRSHFAWKKCSPACEVCSGAPAGSRISCCDPAR